MDFIYPLLRGVAQPEAATPASIRDRPAGLRWWRAHDHALEGRGTRQVGGDGQITEKRESVFTEWDPTAKDDRTALRARFDGTGDGSRMAKTLTELAITTIN